MEKKTEQVRTKITERGKSHDLRLGQPWILMSFSPHVPKILTVHTQKKKLISSIQNIPYSASTLLFLLSLNTILKVGAPLGLLTVYFYPSWCNAALDLKKKGHFYPHKLDIGVPGGYKVLEIDNKMEKNKHSPQKWVWNGGWGAALFMGNSWWMRHEIMQISFSEVLGFNVVRIPTVITTKGGTAKPDTGITCSGFRATACMNGDSVLIYLKLK